MVYLKLQVSGGLGTAVPQTSPYWTFGIFLLAACLGSQEAQGLVLHCLAMFIVIHICEMSTDFNWLFHPPLKFELLHKARLKLPSWPCFIFSSFILDFSLPIVRGGNSVEGFSVVQIVQQVSQRRSDPQQWKETVPCLPASSVCRAWGKSQLANPQGQQGPAFPAQLQELGLAVHCPSAPTPALYSNDNHFHELWRYKYAFSDQKTKLDMKALLCSAKQCWIDPWFTEGIL